MKKAVGIFFVIFLLCGCGVKTEIADSINKEISKDKTIMKYVSGDVSYVHNSVEKVLGKKRFEEFSISLNANDKFENLADSDKYEVLSKIDKIVKRKTDGTYEYMFNCKEGSVCEYTSIQMKYKDDIYSFDNLGLNDKNQLSLNGNEVYSKETEDTDTSIEQESAKEQESAEDIQHKKDLEEADVIYYSISRYSADGKSIVEGKYVLTPLDDSYLKMYNLKNKGFNAELDKNGFVVDRNFFGATPDGKFDIYSVHWKKGSRDVALSVGLGYRNVSRGW